MFPHRTGTDGKKSAFLPGHRTGLQTRNPNLAPPSCTPRIHCPSCTTTPSTSTWTPSHSGLDMHDDAPCMQNKNKWGSILMPREGRSSAFSPINSQERWKAIKSRLITKSRDMLLPVVSVVGPPFPHPVRNQESTEDKIVFQVKDDTSFPVQGKSVMH